MKQIVGYTDPMSVEPGEILRCFVSCPKDLGTYEVRVVRMLAGSPAGEGSGLRYDLVSTGVDRTYEALDHRISPGSYAIAPGPPAGAIQESVVFQINFKPTLRTPDEQVLVAWGDAFRGTGLALFLDADLRLCLAAGGQDGGTRLINERPAELNQWHTARATVVANDLVTLDLSASVPPESWYSTGQRFHGKAPFPSHASIVFAASAIGPQPTGPSEVDRHFNGYLERPLIASSPLAGGESRMLASPSDRIVDVPDSIVALWDFSDAIDSWHVADRGPHQLGATLWNLPRRGVCGSNWENTTTRWTEAPEQYGAIHFLRDAIEDCCWPPAFELLIPLGLRSGFYAIRLRAGDDEDMIPFFVRPRTGRPSSQVVLVAPTATYLSYSNSRFWWERALEEAVADRLLELGPEEQYVLAHPEVGASIYDRHDDGTDLCLASRRRPNLFMRPAHSRHEGYVSDLYIVDWLEQAGIAYDVITDDDLHRDGIGALRGYSVVIAGTHPEYISTQEWDALKAHRDAGGRIMYLGGNGFQGRINFDTERPWIMENRRVDFWLSTNPTRFGETLFATDGHPGGNLAKVGRPAMDLVGVANTTMGFNESRPYVRSLGEGDPRSDFVFEGVDRDIIGDFGLIENGVVGQEWDNASGWVRPEGHILLARSSGHSIVPAIFGASTGDYHADLVLLLTSGGGAVFSAASMAWCAALSHNSFNNDVARITSNVLQRFLDPTSFVASSTASRDTD